MDKIYARIVLRKSVADKDKAEDWFEEVRLCLCGKTTCSIRFRHVSLAEKVEVTNEAVPE